MLDVKMFNYSVHRYEKGFDTWVLPQFSETELVEIYQTELNFQIGKLQKSCEFEFIFANIWLLFYMLRWLYSEVNNSNKFRILSFSKQVHFCIRK